MSECPTRVLVVDDEVDTCSNLRDILEDLGFSVDTACSGEEALELVRTRPYDVALLDLRMPGMDGLELYRRIRELQAGTVALIVTAYASSETAHDALEAGAWRVLSKPVQTEQLINLVDEAMESPLVLVVDDDRDLCANLWDLLRSKNCRVCLAHDIPEAEARLRNNSYRVVLIDMKLPTGTGTQMLHLVRAANPQARTVLITGWRSELEKIVDQALGAGADAVCYKPFQVEELLKTVQSLCAEREDPDARAGH